MRKKASVVSGTGIGRTVSAPTPLFHSAAKDLYTSAVGQPNGGRAVVITLPLGTSQPANGSTGPRLLAKIFAQLGLTGP